MKITLEGEPKEIAALVLAVQERQGNEYSIRSFNKEHIRFVNGMEDALKVGIITQKEYDDFLREHSK